MKVNIVNITPEIAHEMMSRNTNNFRRIDSRKVDQYAREMSKGLWKPNGEAIQVYEDGTLANGQHRLSAVIKAGITIPFVVVTGVNQEVKTFDVGSKRTLSQTAKAMGLSVATQVSGAIAMILFGICDRMNRYGYDEIIDYYLRIQDKIDEVNRVLQHGADKPIIRKAPCVAAAYCAVMLGKISMDDLDLFAQITNKGLPIDGIVANAPLCLRKTVMEGFKDVVGGRVYFGTQSNPWYFEVTYRAICDFAKQSTPQRIYKPKMKADEINIILKQVREMVP